MSVQFDGTNHGHWGNLNPFADLAAWHVSLWWYTVSDPGTIGVFGDQNLSGAQGNTIWIDPVEGARTDVFKGTGNNGSGSFAQVIGDDESVINATWQNFQQTWVQNDNMRGYVGGVEIADGPTATADSAYDGSIRDLTIGNRPAVGGMLARNGDRIAEIAIYQSVLSANHRAGLAKGYTPLAMGVAPSFYASCFTVAHARDMISKTALTEVGAGALVDGVHPPVFSPMIYSVTREAAAVGGFVPYPNPRYSMHGGMQPMGGGV